MPRVWVYQDQKQVKKLGEEAARWYVGFYDPGGKRKCRSCGVGAKGQKAAKTLSDKIAAELLTGTYESTEKKTWEEFRKEYEAKVMEGMAPGSRQCTGIALDHFERIINPKRVQSITSRTFAEYVSERRTEKGLRGGLVSPATINKELRHLRAAIRKAFRWEYLKRVPGIDFLKQAGKLPTYITPEHFAAIYQSCDKATMPTALPYPAADWWRGVLVFAYMTGWRIGSILALRREDVDLDLGTAVSRAEDNKGKRDQKIPLHPLVVEHLRKVPGFNVCFFPWDENRRLLWEEFQAIQKIANVKQTGQKDHYGFHDLRRAFATLNADKLTPDALQALMQHKDYSTTQRYINMARQLNPAVAGLFVPDLKKSVGAG